MKFHRLRKWHWKVLSQLRKLSDEIETIWIIGNHDGPAEDISQLLGITVRMPQTCVNSASGLWLCVWPP